MSNRGQVVIPKALREAAGMVEGDEIEVVLDGQRLILASRGRGQREAELAAKAAQKLEDGQRPSRVWAERVQALADLRRLRAEFAGVDFESVWSESRRELESREPRG